MIHAFKSELRKILTVRSAYIMTLIIIALVAFVSVATLLQQDLTGGVILPTSLESSLYGGIAVAAQLAAVFVVILVGHEYRYNLIHHTLTTIRSRSAVLIAKLTLSVLYALIVAALAAGTAYVASLVAFNFIEESAADQVIDVPRLLTHGLVYVKSYAVIGFILGMLFRTIVAPIVIIILVPGTIEPLIGLLLDGGEKYLPFTSIQSLVAPGMDGDLLRSTITISVYMVAGLAFTWYRFYNKDAN